MPILLIGSTGKTGRYIRSGLEERGHRPKLFVRSAVHAEEGCFVGDVRRPDDVLEALKGADGVICALGTEGGGTLIAGLRNVIDAMQRLGVRRLVTIGTAGILQSAAEPDLLRYQSSETKRTNHEAAMEHEQVYRELLLAELDWTIVCPTRLVQGEPKAAYRVQRDRLPDGGSQITFADTAAFAVAEYFERKHIGRRVGVCE
ncbi:NAD(P)H-binding protein [Paenibacillus sp. N4]|uniref:NAD(P)-dependent oxidoreductase n=1 Tax=Paenibacillus vietnamensis TaxID=2590547 RepID=UPI001CD074A2|nr:NAD(P)H-binding protein [Paenibacillus vietnamensis]MCA0754321.1 NAD(P)H-binding protein [Paenibacillus vietnamensis]